MCSRAPGATFLARHVASDGRRAMESVKLAITNPGFSLVHMPYPCPDQLRLPRAGLPLPGGHLPLHQ